jgi:serine protease
VRRPRPPAAALAATLLALVCAASASAAGRPSVLARVAPGVAAERLGPTARPALAPGVVRILERRAGHPLPALRRWYRVPSASAAGTHRLARALDARSGVAVSVAVRLAPPPSICRIPPAGGWPLVSAGAPTPDLTPFQDHRAGLAIPPGAGGAGVTIGDVEYDWRPGHEELAPRSLPAPVAPAGGLDPAFLAKEHGTAVLALLGAADDGRGVSGLAPAAALRPRSPFSPAGAYVLQGTIADAAAGLRPGDVLLVEQQILVDSDPSPAVQRFVLAPVEADPLSRDVIAAATAAGIVVVEPAGNEGVDLGSLGSPWLAATAGEAGYSGALMVGAGGSAVSPSGDLRTGVRSNFGRRVDVQGYGEGVVTAGYGEGWSPPGDRAYTSCFDGTSAAAATVAGAVAVLQGVVEAAGRAPLAPAVVRARLVATGLPQPSGTTQPIGPRPQVAAAAALALTAAPAL